MSFNYSRRWVMAGAHLTLSTIVVTIAAVIVFHLWFPPPYAAISGGLTLFTILVLVDMTAGPLLTAVVASPGKQRQELLRDLGVIVAIQLAALGYGIYAMALARPVALVFEIDRMRVVTAADIDPTLLSKARPEYRDLSWTGPRLLAAPKPTNPSELARSIDLALAGFDLGVVPPYWTEYDSNRPAVWNAARPVSMLIGKHPELKDNVEQIAGRSGLKSENLRFLPLLSKYASWVSIVAPNADLIGHLPVDGFF